MGFGVVTLIVLYVLVVFGRSLHVLFVFVSYSYVVLFVLVDFGMFLHVALFALIVCLRFWYYLPGHAP